MTSWAGWLGAAALAMGLAVAGPQVPGVAAADRGSADSATSPTDQTSGRADTAEKRGPRPGSAAGRSPHAAGVTRAAANSARPDSRIGASRAVAVAPSDRESVPQETFAPGAPSEVVSIPQTPLLTALGLQEIPVVGPMLVTPIVTAVKQIPIVSDLLHPLIGYPRLPEGVAAPRDVRVVSFDGTEINVHLMPATGLRTGQKAPTVLIAAALGTPGATTLNGTPIDLILADLGGEVGVATLRNAGYNVVTWDPRGAYFSGGALQIDSPDFEARDVSAIITWVAQQPETQLDGPADPRMGMVGASYGSGIQLVTAATDHRVDAIVPVLAWNTLNTALYRNGAFKTASGTALAATLVVTLTRMNPHIVPTVIYGALTGTMTATGQDLLARSGPGAIGGHPDLVGRITAPTLLIQGTVDTLTTLKEADLNARALLAQHVPIKVIWFAGGHGVGIHNVFDLSDGALLEQPTIAWLDRYVKGQPVPTGPAFEWIDQRGRHLSAGTYPGPHGRPLVASRRSGDQLALLPFVGGSGPMFLVLPLGATKAFNTLNLDTPPVATTTYLAGEPLLTLSYSGTGIGEHIYAQLLDSTTGLVLGNQVTPIPVILDGQDHTISVPLELVAHTLNPGQTVTLQLFSWSAAHAASSALGTLTVSDIRVALPTVGDVTEIPHRI
jgi:ABC-2 type transport system ATP-binding protein